MKKTTVKIVSLIFVFGALLFPGTALAATPRTSTVWTVSDSKGINVIPYVRVDKRALFVDFDHFSSDMDYIYYNLNYTNKDTGIKGGVEGSFSTNPLPKFDSYGGFDYVRRELVFGTCSKKVCNYHKPKEVTLTVNSHFSKGSVSQYTKVLSFLDDQF